VIHVDVNHSSNPDTIRGLIDDYKPEMMFLCPGGDHRLVNLIEGDTLEHLLLESSARTAKIPVIIVFSQSHG
jgi:hypothetical protein